MTIKQKLIAEINKKAQKIREKRVEAAGNKTIEAAVFEFFKNIEESRQLHGGSRYDYDLLSKAKNALQERLYAFDHKVKVSVEYNVSQDPLSFEEQTVRGITIWWSPLYIKRNNVDASLYIDVSQMLFI